MTDKNFVIYTRVSTMRQGESGLGLEAQTKTCKDYITSQRGILVNSFCDVMSGTKRNRPELIKAVDYCKEKDCTLVIAKLDRLARDCEFVFRIVNTGISIYFCDLPVVNTMILGVFASVAQYERELTSKRTKDALNAKKARGEKLGAASEKYSVDKGAQELGRIKASKSRNDKTIHDPEFLSFCRILKRTSKVLQGSDDSLQGPDDLFMLSWMDYKAQVLKSLTRPDLLNILGQMRNAKADNKDLFKSYTLDDSEHQLSLIRSKINNTFRIIETYNKNNTIMKKNLKDLQIGDKVYCTGNSGFCDSSVDTIIGIGYNKIYNNKKHERVIYLDEDKDEGYLVFDGITGEALTEPTAYYIQTI